MLGTSWTAPEVIERDQVTIYLRSAWSPVDISEEEGDLGQSSKQVSQMRLANLYSKSKSKSIRAHHHQVASAEDDCEGKLVIPRVGLGRFAARKGAKGEGRAPKVRSPSSHHGGLPLPSPSCDLAVESMRNRPSKRVNFVLFSDFSRRVLVSKYALLWLPTLGSRSRFLLEFCTDSLRLDLVFNGYIPPLW